MFLAEAPNDEIRGLIEARMQQEQAAGAAARAKSVMQKVKHREGGAMQKGAKGPKQCKKGVQPSRAKQSAAGKAGSREIASMLKMAKYTEMHLQQQPSCHS